MDYEQICYSWLHGGNYKGPAPDGWGIAAASNTDSAFLKSAVDLMTNRQASPSGEITEYFEYSEAFRSFIYLGVKRIASLPQMGGGDNNRLMHLYVPTLTEDGFPDLVYTDYFDTVPDPGQRGIIDKAEFSIKTYDYQELLRKYGFHKEQGEAAANRFAVLLSLLYLSFYSDEWKQLIFPLKEQDPYETAREITWLLHRLVPEEIFGKTRKELIHRLGYAVTESVEGYQLTFVRGNSERTTLKEHVYDLNGNYGASAAISREMMDRKVSGTAELFLTLAKEAQESPKAINTLVKEILNIASGAVDDIQELSRAYQSDYIPYKLYDGMSKELYACSTLEGLAELNANDREELMEGINRYRCCNPKTSTAIYLVGGTEVIKLLADVDADAELCDRVLEKFEETDRFSGILEEIPVEERASVHLILERLKAFFWMKEAAPKDLIDEENETAWEEPVEKTEEDFPPSPKDHSDTAARMDALSGNKKKGNFLLNFLKKKD